MARWDGALYAANTAHHRRFDTEFLAGLELPSDARVLDLGCGAGDFTARLGQFVPHGSVLGVDADPTMVAAARERHSGGNIRFALGSAQELDAVVPPSTQDAVVSVAVLHWISAAEQPGVLAQVQRALRPGGVFRAEFGGHGQIRATRQLLDEEAARLGGEVACWFFPLPGAYRQLLDAAGFAVEPDGWVRLRQQRRSLPDIAALLGWLRSQVLIAYEPGLRAGRFPEFCQRVEDLAIRELRRKDGSYDQDYVRLDLRVTAA